MESALPRYDIKPALSGVVELLRGMRLGDVGCLGKAAAELPHSKLAVAEAESFPAGVGGPAAVYDKGVAVDEGAFGGVGQEGYGASDVVGRGESSHRDA